MIMCLIFSKTCLQNSKAVLYCNWVIFMKNTLIRDINNYISYLQKTGLWVTVHGKGIGGLLEHNIHENPYCAYVKTDEDKEKTHALFVAFAPADNPQIITLVVIQAPKGVYYGGTIAAPVVRKLYENILPYLEIEKSSKDTERE